MGKYTLQQICRGALIWVTLISAVFLTWLLSRDTGAGAVPGGALSCVSFPRCRELVQQLQRSGTASWAYCRPGQLGDQCDSDTDFCDYRGLIGQAYDGTVVPLVAGFCLRPGDQSGCFQYPEYLPKAA